MKRKAKERPDKIFAFVLKCCRLAESNGGAYSFATNIRNGCALVECRPYEIYIEASIKGENVEEVVDRFAGTPVAAANRLEMLGADFDTLNI